MKRGTKGLIASGLIGLVLAVGSFGTYKYTTIRTKVDAKRTASAEAIFDKGIVLFNSGSHIKAIKLFTEAKKVLDCESQLFSSNCYGLEKSLDSAIETGNKCEKEKLECKIQAAGYEAKHSNEKSETDDIVLKIQEAQKKPYNDSEIAQLESLCAQKCSAADKSYKSAWIGISNMWMNEISEYEKSNRETNWAKNSRIKAINHALQAKNLSSEEKGLLHYNLALLYETTWVNSSDGKRYLTEESNENYLVAGEIFAKILEKNPKNADARFFQLEVKYKDIDEYCYNRKVKENIASGEMSQKDHECYPYIAGLDAKNLIVDYNEFLNEFTGGDTDLRAVIGSRIDRLETLIDSKYEHGGAPPAESIFVDENAAGTLRADYKTEAATGN